MEKTGAIADEPSTLVFERLKEAVESRAIATEGAERMDTLSEDVQNVQLIQELRQQRNKLNYQGRLLDPVRPGIYRGALIQQQSPATNQAAVQNPAQGYSPALGYEDWQSNTRAPFLPQDYQSP